MKESWTARLDVAATEFRTVLMASRRKKDKILCNIQLHRGKLRRAKYMLQGIKLFCKNGRMEGRTGGKENTLLRARIRNKIAGYAFEALSSNGREHFENSRVWLRKDPVWVAAQRYERNRQRKLKRCEALRGSPLSKGGRNSINSV